MQKFNVSEQLMDFRTKVELPLGQVSIGHADPMMLWGSCFAENIGKRLTDNKFSCDVNPFGVLYNPLSIAEAIRELMTGKLYTPDNLMKYDENWLSLMHHSSFSSRSLEECLTRINHRMQNGGIHLRTSDWLLFTWGTARVYQWKEDGRIVGNCHKLPERYFTRRLLSVEEIVSGYLKLLEELHERNPRIKVLFTVSPIRHAKDGMHGNQLNKSVLLLAIDELCNRLSYCYYFPSYEILMDELRDYRFYADDMLHPSPVAVNYIWECFCETYFTSDTRKVMQEWEKIRKGLEHRPFDAQSDAYLRFLSQILLKIEALKEKFPYLDVQNEIELCQALLKK